MQNAAATGSHLLLLGEGWYRLGLKLDGENVNHDFGWAALDVRVREQFGSEGLDIEETWKVSPQV